MKTRHIPMIGLLAMAFALLPLQLRAQESYTVALFTPNLNFSDGVARNDFVSEVAEELESETGLTWTGQAFARQSDFEASLRQGIDLAIIDGEFYAAKGRSLTPIASLKAHGETAIAMRLLVSSEISSVYELKGKRLALTRAGGYTEDLIGAELLGGEVDAKDFFGDIDYVKDARSALNALSLGKADAILVFDDYKKSNKSLFKTSSVPLPVIALTNDQLPESVQTDIKRAVRSLSVSGASLVDSSGSYAGDAVRSFRSATKKSASRPDIEMAQMTTIDLDIGSVDLKLEGDALKPEAGGEHFFLPPLEALTPSEFE